MRYSIIDIETTGGNAIRDKITEIAVYVHDGTAVVDEFTSLVNPECSIPPYISRLTGITDEMVSDAPRFYEIAKRIVQLTEGCVFVAHNAPFDYSFIREEFKSLGFSFNKDYLCTVRLSRKLIPGYRSYSLGNICNDLGILIENRHRAAGDAYATVKLFEILLQKDAEGGLMNQYIKNDYLHLRFPPGFDRKLVEALPEEAGVYYLHNEDGSIIYIGKSNNIRKRVLTHFANKQNRRALELRNSIADVSYEVTGSELIALLLESEEIKMRQPLFNRAQKKLLFNYGIFSGVNKDGYMTLSVSKINERWNEGEPVLTTSSEDEALAIVEKLVGKFKLCQKLCGVYEIAHACFAHAIGQCDGACVGKESSALYNERLEKALESLQYKHPNFLIVGRGRTHSERSVVNIEKGKYIGYGFFDTEFTPAYPELLKDCIRQRNDNRDVHKIIRHFLMKTESKDLIVY